MESSPTPTVPAARGPVAYLINQYPKVSHSFIRREIAALEDLSQPVLRFAVRRTDEPLPDPDDRTELDRTHHLLDRPAWAAGRPGRRPAAAPAAFFTGRPRERPRCPLGVVYLPPPG